MSDIRVGVNGEVYPDLSERVTKFQHIYIKDGQEFHVDSFQSAIELIGMSRPQVGEYVSFEFERFTELKEPRDANFFGKVKHSFIAKQVKKNSTVTIERFYRVEKILHSGNYAVIRFYIKEVTYEEFIEA